MTKSLHVQNNQPIFWDGLVEIEAQLLRTMNASEIREYQQLGHLINTSETESTTTSTTSRTLPWKVQAWQFGQLKKKKTMNYLQLLRSIHSVARVAPFSPQIVTGCNRQVSTTDMDPVESNTAWMVPGHDLQGFMIVCHCFSRRVYHGIPARYPFMDKIEMSYPFLMFRVSRYTESQVASISWPLSLVFLWTLPRWCLCVTACVFVCNSGWPWLVSPPFNYRDCEVLPANFAPGLVFFWLGIPILCRTRLGVPQYIFWSQTVHRLESPLCKTAACLLDDDFVALCTRIKLLHLNVDIVDYYFAYICKYSDIHINIL